MNNKAFVFIYLVFVSSVNPMQPYNSLTDLPQEMHALISSFIVSTSASAEQAAISIRSLTRTSTHCRCLHNNSTMCLTTIRTIAKKFGCSDEDAATALRTKGAEERLYLQKELTDLCSEFIFPENKIKSLLLLHKEIDLKFTYNYKPLHNKSLQVTPLMMISLKIFWKRSNAIKQFLNMGVNINGTNQYGQSALMIAAKYSKRLPFQQLIDCQNLDINQQDCDGNTALLHSLQTPLYPPTNIYYQMNIVRMLLNAGANPYIANYAGLTPLAIAQRANNIHAINLITNAIARKNTLQK